MSLSVRARRLAGIGARFLTVGAVSTFIEIAAFNLLYLTFGWDVVAAKIAASLVALVNAYVGNRQWTFRHRDRRRLWVEIVLFVVVNVGCTVLGVLLVWGGVELVAVALGRPAGPVAVNVVNLISIVVVVVARFFFYHALVFRTRAPSPSVADDARA
ncbi:GtrA family protein [Microbacterium sp.]|uniref:GtrA family protein n=1 Tax=Microbacterium sp. TaxID=51671 RepID=UPI003C77BFC0